MRKKSKKMIIKAEDIKVSTGHRQHFTGTGAWTIARNVNALDPHKLGQS